MLPNKRKARRSFVQIWISTDIEKLSKAKPLMKTSFV